MRHGKIGVALKPVLFQAGVAHQTMTVDRPVERAVAPENDSRMIREIWVSGVIVFSRENAPVQ